MVCDQDQLIFYVFCVEFDIVTYKMHLEVGVEFCWSHVQNAFGSRSFVVTHPYQSELF